MDIQVSRRTLLTAATTVAAGHLLGLGEGLAVAASDGPSAPIAPLPRMWAAGTPGDYNWQALVADSAEEAFSRWCVEHGYDRGRVPVLTSDHVMRVPAWDGIAVSDLKPADWIEAGLGHFCQRCDCETSHDCGGVVNGEVVCHDCMTYVDKLDYDEETGYEQLVELIADKGVDGAIKVISYDDDFAAIDPAVWAKAVAEAATLV